MWFLGEDEIYSRRMSRIALDFEHFVFIAIKLFDSLFVDEARFSF